MEKRETTVTIAELAQKERVDSEAQAQEVLGQLQETGGLAKPETPVAEILGLPQHEIKTSPGIQIVSNTQILNRNDKEGSVEHSGTWKKELDKKQQRRGH